MYVSVVMHHWIICLGLWLNRSMEISGWYGAGVKNWTDFHSRWKPLAGICPTLQLMEKCCRTTRSLVLNYYLSAHRLSALLDLQVFSDRETTFISHQSSHFDHSDLFQNIRFLLQLFLFDSLYFDFTDIYLLLPVYWLQS